MSAAKTGPDQRADSGADLVAAAHAAEALAAARHAAAGEELVRPPGFAIDDGVRARSAVIVEQLVIAVAAVLRVAEPAFADLPDSAAITRFATTNLLRHSGVGAAALHRAEEYRLAAALVAGASDEEGPGARRLDPIGGSFVAESFAVRAAEAARLDRAGEPLLPLPDLDPEERHALFWQVAACLADALMAVDDRPIAAIHRLAAAAVARALAGIDDGDGIGPAAMSLAHALAAARQIDDELLAGTLAGGRIATLAAMFAVRAGVSFSAASAMLTDPARAAILMRGCGVTRAVATAMILALCYALDRGHGADPAERATALAAAYETLPIEVAEAEVRRMRLEPIYRELSIAWAGAGVEP